MKALREMTLVACLLGLSGLGLADDISGPGHTTIRATPWGSIFYKPSALGAHQMETVNDEIKIKRSSGELKIQGSDLMGYRLIQGKDVMSLEWGLDGLKIRWQKNTWTLRPKNGNYTLESSDPQDTVVFECNGNNYIIKGKLGHVSISTKPGEVLIQSPLGKSMVVREMGKRSISGPAISQIPYLGRGLYLSFHGLGLLIDIHKLFPIFELAEWTEWKPVMGKPFNPEG